MPAALLRSLIVDGLLNALRAADRARQGIEHRFAPLGRLLSLGCALNGRLAAAAAGQRRRERGEQDCVAKHEHVPPSRLCGESSTRA